MLKIGLSPKLKNLPVDKLIGSARSCEQSSSFKQPKGANRSLLLGHNSFIDSLILSPQAGKDDYNNRNGSLPALESIPKIDHKKFM